MFAVIPPDFDLAAVYQDDAYWNGGTEYGYRDYDEEWQLAAKTGARRLRRIAQFHRPGRMLEVGCASGEMLKLAHGDGWEVAGVELNEVMRERCKQALDCPLFASVDEVESTAARFDCVLALEVIEHVPDPVAFVRRMAALLDPGGLLVLSTPNFDCPKAKARPEQRDYLQPPAHISMFGVRNLAECVRRGGLAVEKIHGAFGSEELPIPPWIAALLRPIRRGKRLRPKGVIGKVLKAWQRSRPDALHWADSLELYARKPG